MKTRTIKYLDGAKITIAPEHTNTGGVLGIWEGMEVCLPPETSLEQWFNNHWVAKFSGKRLYRESDIADLIRKVSEEKE